MYKQGIHGATNSTFAAGGGATTFTAAVGGCSSLKSKSLTARRPALWAKKNRTPNKIAAAKSGATAQTTTAPLSRDATAASHAVENSAIETLKMRGRYATVLQQHEGNHTEAAAILEDVARRCRRVFGNDHPLTARAQGALADARRLLSKS